MRPQPGVGSGRQACGAVRVPGFRSLLPSPARGMWEEQPLRPGSQAHGHRTGHSGWVACWWLGSPPACCKLSWDGLTTAAGSHQAVKFNPRPVLLH